MFISKRKIKEFLQDYSGASALRWSYPRHGLYVFNYHRIGDALATAYDPNVFSCTEDSFATHLDFYKKEFDMLDMGELSDVLNAGNKGRFGLITFDDGYIDNYQLAYPQLKSAALSATFFVPTNYIGSSKIPWWDEVAFIVKNSVSKSVVMNSVTVEIDRANIKKTIRAVLNAFKRDVRAVDVKLDECRRIFRPEKELKPGQLFIDWTQLEEMQRGGMTIGSHTCSHEILSHLGEAEQRDELERSKNIIEGKLGVPVTTVAYPVGGYDCYNTLTCNTAQSAGYQLAFTFTNAVNDVGSIDRFCISRIGVDDNVNTVDLKRKIAFSTRI